MTSFTLDTTVLVKALVKPRRIKDDAICREQIRVHDIAQSIINRVESGKDKMHIPSIAIVETAAVVSRLTGSEDIGKESAAFVMDLADSVLYDIA